MLFLLSLYLISVVASPLPAFKPTPDSNDLALIKRVKLQAPDFEDSYSGRIQKGIWLKSLFSLNDEDAKQWASPFQNAADVITWGWTPRLQASWWPYIDKDGPIKAEFGKDLDKAFADPALKVDKSTNGVYQFLHDTEFKYKDGRKGKPTLAKYKNVANPRSGAFIFDSNWSPKYQQARLGRGDVPDLDTLSDLAYFQWQDSCVYTGTALSSLKVIFRAHVEYLPSFWTVVEAMIEAGHQRIPSWNRRVTFSMDSSGGLAILGSAHGASTAWFLIQHRETLGAKRIKEAVVWGGGYGYEFHENPKKAKLTIRFTIVDA
ncbi:hypothetical protein LZ30DRAFT_598142 [Colletotrichum cereale]|nr:hypothetical protein LZ30DRAFT_598142 [Colletotrichum cereale]